jgi:hypothetical protein
VSGAVDNSHRTSSIARPAAATKGGCPEVSFGQLFQAVDPASDLAMAA